MRTETENSLAGFRVGYAILPKDFANQLHEHQILIKPLNDPRLGAGFMRVTTAFPEDNARFLQVLKTLL